MNLSDAPRRHRRDSLPLAITTLAARSALHYTPPDPTGLPTIERVETSAPGIQRPSEQEGTLRAAFRDLHGPHLHGFALLVTLGDRPLAAQLAADALGEGTRRAAELTHPERAGAWLRGIVTRRARRSRGLGPGREERRAALTGLGVDRATFDTLAEMTPVERATLVAGAIERFDARDLELVLGTGPASVHRQAAAVRRRFLERRAAKSTTESLAEPLLAHRIGEIAERALSWHR